MRINNNFNVLPFYDSLQKQNSKKWYSFGQHYPLICPNNTILPFQFITDSEVTVSSNIEAVNVHSGKVTNLGVRPSVSKGTQADATYYIVKMVETTISAMPEGLHYLRINTNKGYLYSEEFTYNANHEECIKIEYWNENTLNFNSGEINFDDDFRFILYIPSTIGKPEYEFEEELTKRLGYKFIESQTSNKIYKFNFLAPEYICDAMRLIRLCDYIKLTTKFDTFNALSFAYEPKWQDNGDLAAVDVEFDTDCIIQKLESFNRRLKESFYNALLADIDEPVLFSNDIVAQYYTEFTTTSYISGKLIRQLEAINEAELGSLENLVLPIDNQADTEQKAKKITLASLKNVLIKLADYVTLSTAQNINGEKNFIGGLKVNGSPIIYDSVNKCWKLQGNLVLTGGITMYADDGTLNLPSIYDGLPIDGTTIYWDTDAAGNRVLKAVGGGGTADSVAWNNITGKPSWIGSSKPTYSYSEIQNTPDLSQYALQTALDTTNTEVAKKWTKDNSKIANWDSAFGWGNHANAGYVKKTYVDETFVNLTGEQTISGKKNFTTGGLFVNGSQIKYDSTKKYWKLDGDLLVTGGITMYGNEGTYTPSTIMDAIAVDGVTISKSGGVLKVIGGTGGGVADSVAWSNITGKPNFASVATSGKYDDLIGKPTLLSSFTDDVVSGKYLPLSGGTLTGNILLGGTTTNKIGTNIVDTTSWQEFTHKNSHGYIAIGPFNDSVAHIYTDRPSFYFNKELYVNSAKVWNAGNDGSGSTLDADLLDGKHLSDILASNVASATKLQTTRTIWGQNFDGSGNVDGNMLLKGQYVEITLQGTNSYNTGICFNDYEGNLRWYLSYRGLNAADKDFYIYRLTDDNSNHVAMSLIRSNGNVGIGTASPQQKLHVEGHILANGDIAAKTNIQSYGNLIVNGNVGIGTENPAYKFHVAGAGYFESYLSIGTASTASLSMNRTSANYITTPTSGYMVFCMGGNGTSVNSSNLVLYTHDVAMAMSGGNVGIGTALNVGHKLAVNGDSVTNNIRTQSIMLGHSDVSSSHVSDRWYYASITYINEGQSPSYLNPALVFKTMNNTYKPGTEVERMRLCSNGNLSIGYAGNKGTKLYVEGSILASGGITMYSDQRKKTILNHVELSLKDIANAPLIEHYYNNDDKKTTHVGSIAQYWASMNDWFCKLDSEGYYTMEIQNAALASAISIARELDRYETKTDTAIKKLKKRICELEEEIERLKSA